MAKPLYGVWVTSTCDRDAEDGWMYRDGAPWTGTHAEASAYATSLSQKPDRHRFGHEVRPFKSK